MISNKVNKTLNQWLESRDRILHEVNSRNDLDFKTVIHKAKQIEDLSNKITVLIMIKAK